MRPVISAEQSERGMAGCRRRACPPRPARAADRSVVAIAGDAEQLTSLPAQAKRYRDT